MPFLSLLMEDMVLVLTTWEQHHYMEPMHKCLVKEVYSPMKMDQDIREIENFVHKEQEKLPKAWDIL